MTKIELEKQLKKVQKESDDYYHGLCKVSKEKEKVEELLQLATETAAYQHETLKELLGVNIKYEKVIAALSVSLYVKAEEAVNAKP